MEANRAIAIAIAATVAALSLLLAPPALAERPDASRTVKVMTRNVYVGSDLSAATDAQNFNEFIAAAADILAEVQRTDFPARAKLLAREIASEKPDLVGLQEAVIWRLDTTEEDGTDSSDGDLGETPANEVLYDSLKILTQELAARGADYRVAHVQQEADAEVPVEERPGDLHDDPEDGTYDVRVTDRDVVLARRGAGVKIQAARGAHFEHLWTPTLAGAVEFPFLRGWQRVDANVRGTHLRFMNTHLEPFGDPGIKVDQAREYVEAARGKRPAILVGDLNTDDDTVPRDQRDAYAVIRKAGFVERQTAKPTCCHSSAMTDPDDRMTEAIDKIMVDDPRVELRRSVLTGVDPALRTPDGLWPADHAGVFSALVFP